MVHPTLPGSRRTRSMGVLAALFLAASASHAVAAPERDDDVEFAIRLAQRGYPSLAQAEIDRMLVNATPERREKAEYTRCELLRRAALLAASKADSPPADVRARFAEARAAYEGFLKSYRSGTRVADAEFSNANLLRDFGYFLSKRRADFTDQAQALKEAESAFDESIRLLAIVRDRESKKVDALESAEKDASEPLQLRNVAWYYLCVAMYERALLYPVGDALRIQGLTKAIDDELYPFLEEEDGNIPGYHAALWMGKAFLERGRKKDGWDADDVKQAKEWISVTVDACDLEGAGSWPALANVIYEAAREYGRMCNELGTVGSVNYPQEFVKRMNSLEVKLPAIRTQRAGLEALIEKCRALASIGLHAQAVRDVNAVSEAALKADPSWGRGVDFLARQALNDLLSAIPPDSNVRISPQMLEKAGEGSVQAGNPRQAISALQRLLTAVESEPDAGRRKGLMAEYHTKTWTTIAYCYLELERYREMFIAADQPVQRYLADKRTDEDQDIGKCVKLRVDALKYLAQGAKDDSLRAEADAARKFATENFPWIEGSNINFEQALAEMDKASRALRQGDKEESAASYAKAVDLFGRLAEKEPLHLKAQSRIGECLVLANRAEDARKHLEAFLKKNATYFNDANTPPPRRQPQGWGIFWLANAYSELKQPAKVVEILTDFEKRMEGASLDNTIPRVRYLRVQALVSSNRTADAEKEVAALKSEAPDNAWTAPAALAVANALYQEYTKEKDKDPVGAKSSLGRAVDLYDFWIGRTESPSPDHHLFVGRMNQELGRFERATQELEEALRQEVEARNDDKADSIRVNLVELLIDQQEYAKALPKLEHLFVKPQADRERLIAFFEALNLRHPSVDLGVHKESVKKAARDAVARAALLPAGAPLKTGAEALINKSDFDATDLVELYNGAGTEALTALASGCALSTLAATNALSPNMRKETFELVKRTPDLMSSLSRCHEAQVSPENINSAFTAINLLQMLIDSAPNSDEEKRPEGYRYTARWFEWKYRLMAVFRTLGVTSRQDGPLQIVCALHKSMTTLGEIEKAEALQPGMKKKFDSLKDEVEAALRKLGKTGGCE